ncbi:hypothetical protein Bbelb_313680 [Branchiostoma belcheri]|nr:hypothetical protein Bbelb_313680 [Branchiostoma belcheri]
MSVAMLEEVDADLSFEAQPAAALHPEPISPPGRVDARIHSLQTDDLTESKADPEASGLIRKIFGLPIFRKRRHVPDQPDDSSSGSNLFVGEKSHRFPQYELTKGQQQQDLMSFTEKED